MKFRLKMILCILHFSGKQGSRPKESLRNMSIKQTSPNQGISDISRLKYTIAMGYGYSVTPITTLYFKWNNFVYVCYVGSSLQAQNMRERQHVFLLSLEL